MVKAVDKEMVIGEIGLMEKSGGQGTWKVEKWKSGTVEDSRSEVNVLVAIITASRRGRYRWRTSTSSAGAFRISTSFTRTIAIPTSTLRRPPMSRSRSAATDAVEHAARLRWLHCSAHAVGHFRLANLAAKDVLVTDSTRHPIDAHCRARHGRPPALVRRLPQSFRRQEEHGRLPNELVGDAAPWLISGKTMGIIGLGTLGQAIAARAKAFGMRVVGMRRNPERDAPAGVDEVIGRSDLDRMVKVADVIVLAAPWTVGTDQILDAAAIGKMKRTAIVINVARGQLVDESALATALSLGRLGGAVLDVFTVEPLPATSPFWSMPNVIITPHTAGFRAGHFDAVIDLFAENLQRFERGSTLLNVVDLKVGY